MAKKKSTLAAKREFSQLRRELDKRNSTSIMSVHKVGLLVDALCPREKRAYGQKNIERLATELGGDATLANRLWSARKLAVAIPKDYLDSLTEKVDEGRV